MIIHDDDDKMMMIAIVILIMMKIMMMIDMIDMMAIMIGKCDEDIPDYMT